LNDEHRQTDQVAILHGRSGPGQIALATRRSRGNSDRQARARWLCLASRGTGSARW
jgi:hypothetical protein